MNNILLSIIASLTAVSVFAAPQAIVFDFGGVMTGEQDRNAVVNFICESFHFSKAEFEQANL